MNASSGFKLLRPGRARSAGFTMMEIAICLAIIGFALVAIIGVLPIGMNTQKANREETIINQDATVLIQAIRSGAHGLDDLTNYVYAITNSGANTWWNGFDSTYLTNGANIIGLLSTPEYVPGPSRGVQFSGSDRGTAAVMPSQFYSQAASNHIVAYVRSISGLAAEQPPQNNPIMREDSFSYKLYVVNAPMPVDTNILQNYPMWDSGKGYRQGNQVFYNGFCWRATASTQGDPPGALEAYPPSTRYFGPGGAQNPWVKVQNYNLEQAANQRELRLTFLWPLLPNGKVGPGNKTFRVTIPGQLLADTNTIKPTLYFYHPQSFSNFP